MQRRQVLFSIGLVVLLTVLVTGIAGAKGHVPVTQVQVCHRGTAHAVDAPALAAHLAHGDIRLPACDFDTVFFEGDDCSDAVDANGDGLADLPVPGHDPLPATGNACGVTPACPAGGIGGPQPAGCF